MTKENQIARTIFPDQPNTGVVQVANDVERRLRELDRKQEDLLDVVNAILLILEKQKR